MVSAHMLEKAMSKVPRPQRVLWLWVADCQKPWLEAKTELQGAASWIQGLYQAFKWSFSLLQASGLQRFGIDTQIDCFGRSDQIQQPVETDFGPNRTNCNRTGHFHIASTLPPWHLPRRLRSRPSWNGSFLRTICELCSPWSRHSRTWKSQRG